MKSGSNIIKRYRIILAIISVLLVLSSSAVITGSWFTDTETIRGNFTQPVYAMTITATDDENNDHSSEFYLTYDGTSSSLEKTIGITIASTTNVTKNVLRVMVVVEWGTIENETFTADVDNQEVSPPLSNALVPNYNGSNWTGSRAAQDPDLTQHYYYTPTDPTYYYYNTILQRNNSVTLFTSLSFANGTNTSLYEGKTAKITIISELVSAQADLEYYGWTISGNDTNYEYGDCAPASWATSIGNQLAQA